MYFPYKTDLSKSYNTDCLRAVMCRGLYHPSLQIFVVTRQNRDYTPLTYTYFLNAERWWIKPYVLLKAQTPPTSSQESLQHPPQTWTQACIWDSTLRSLSVLCIFLLGAGPDTVSSLQHVCFSCPVMSDSLWLHGLCSPGSSDRGILQARILEWVAIPFSRGSSRPRDRTQVSCIAGLILYHLSH